MSDYELYHSGARKKHKYIKKIGDRYFYTQQEIAAYLDKKRGQADNVKEAVAEATGRRDVYWEAPKVTERGRTFYDDEASTLRTGKKDRRGKVDEDGTVYTDHDTMQYDNRYTEERNRKTRERGRKKLKKMATKPVRDLKKQASKGKKAVNKFYRNNVKPQTHVVYSDGTSKRLD